MPSSPSSVETFLLAFHAQHARDGCALFDVGEITPGFGSYDLLVRAVESASRVLDVGCGDGALLAKLDELRPGSAIGLDFSPDVLAAARARLPDRVRLIQAWAQEMPLEDGAVEAVVSHMALMLMDDLHRVLREVRRVMHPGGVFCAVVSGPPHPSEESRRFFSVLRDCLREEDVTPRFGADCFRSVEDIPAAWCAAGFDAPAIEDHELTRRVPADRLRAFFKQSYYPVALLSPAGQAALAARAEEVLRPHVHDGCLSWRSTVRCIHTRARPA